MAIEQWQVARITCAFCGDFIQGEPYSWDTCPDEDASEKAEEQAIEAAEKAYWHCIESDVWVCPRHAKQIPVGGSSSSSS